MFAVAVAGFLASSPAMSSPENPFSRPLIMAVLKKQSAELLERVARGEARAAAQDLRTQELLRRHTLGDERLARIRAAKDGRP